MADRMKCIVKTKAGPGNLELCMRPVPEPGPQDMLVKVLATAICGTDVHIQEWNDFIERRLKPPLIIGHEFAGEVIAVGELVTNVKAGDIVSAETHIVCNSCELCHNGNAHVCYNTRSISLYRDGCFAEYIAMPAENAFVCDPAVPIEVLSILEPFGAAVHGVMEFPVTAKSVAIVGCGPIGAMAVAVAKKAGAAKAIAVEPNKMRREMARKMGADAIVNPRAEDPVEAVRALTNGRGVDNVVELSGSIPAIKAAIEYCKPEAKIAAVGLPSHPIEFNFAEFVYRGLTLKGIAGRRMYQTWEQMRGLLASGVDIAPVVTHVLPMEEYEEGLRLMRAGECGKVVLKP